MPSLANTLARKYSSRSRPFYSPIGRQARLLLNTSLALHIPLYSLPPHFRQPKLRAFMRWLPIQVLTKSITGRIPANASGYLKRSYRKCFDPLHACDITGPHFHRKLSFTRTKPHSRRKSSFRIAPYNASMSTDDGRGELTLAQRARGWL